MNSPMTSAADPQTNSPWRGFWRGASGMLPLCLSVVPWGILAGSMAVQAGLTLPQSIAMSTVIFAGAAQLVTLGMLISGASVATIIISVFFITAQHFLYGLTMRETVSLLQARYRLPIGFLLTDELFALSCAQPREKRTPGFLIGAGITFYLSWALCSLLGIAMASSVPDLERYHLDFSIVATFITLVVPMIKNISVLSGAIASLLLSMVLSLYQIEGAIAIAGAGGMCCAVTVARIRREV